MAKSKHDMIDDFLALVNKFNPRASVTLWVSDETYEYLYAIATVVDGTLVEQWTLACDELITITPLRDDDKHAITLHL